VEQRVHLQQQLQQQDARQLQQLSESIGEQRGQLARSLWSARSARREIAAALTELARLQSEQAEVNQQLRTAEAERQEVDQLRESLRRQLHDCQAQLRTTVESSHATDLQIEKIHLEREQLAVRLREDYGIDLAELDCADESPQAQAERAEI